MRRRSLIAVAIAVVWVVATSIVALWQYAGFRADVAKADQLAGPLRDALTARVVDLLEHDPTWKVAAIRADHLRPVCEADVFGVAPRSAATIDDVRTVYASIACKYIAPEEIAAGPARLDLQLMFAECAPIAVQLRPSVRYEVPGDGAEYGPSIERIFPKPLQKAAYRPQGCKDQTAAVDQRIVQLVTAGQPSAVSPSHS